MSLVKKKGSGLFMVLVIVSAIFLYSHFSKKEAGAMSVIQDDLGSCENSRSNYDANPVWKCVADCEMLTSSMVACTDFNPLDDDKVGKYVHLIAEVPCDDTWLNSNLLYTCYYGSGNNGGGDDDLGGGDTDVSGKWYTTVLFGECEPADDWMGALFTFNCLNLMNLLGVVAVVVIVGILKKR